MCLSFLEFPRGLIVTACSSTSVSNCKPRIYCLVSGFCKNLKLGTGFIKSFLEVDKPFSKFCANLGWIQSQPEPINFLAGKIVTYDGCVCSRWLYIKMGDFGWIRLWICWHFPPTGTKCDSGLVYFCPLRFLAGSLTCCHLVSQAERDFIQYWTFPSACVSIRFNFQKEWGSMTWTRTGHKREQISTYKCYEGRNFCCSYSSSNSA